MHFPGQSASTFPINTLAGHAGFSRGDEILEEERNETVSGVKRPSLSSFQAFLISIFLISKLDLESLTTISNQRLAKEKISQVKEISGKDASFLGLSRESVFLISLP